MKTKKYSFLKSQFKYMGVCVIRGWSGMFMDVSDMDSRLQMELKNIKE